MISVIDILIFVLVFIVTIDLMVICKILINKLNNNLRMERKEKIFSEYITKFFRTGKMGADQNSLRYLLEYFDQFIQLRQSVYLDKIKNNESLNISLAPKAEEYYCKKLFSKLKFVRLNSAMHLAYSNNIIALENLHKALEVEKNVVVKLYIAYALSSINNKDSLPLLVGSLLKKPIWYRQKVNIFILDFGKEFFDYLPNIINDNSQEIKELIIDFAAVFPAEKLRDYLFDTILVDNEIYLNIEFFNKVLFTIEELYFKDIIVEKYFNHENKLIRNCAIRSLSKNPTIENFNMLLSQLSKNDNKNNQDIIFSLSRIIKSEPVYINQLIEIFILTKDENTQNGVAQMLAVKIEYLILKLLTKEKIQVRDVIKKIIKLEKNSSIIGFLNRNTNIELENELVEIIKEVFFESETVAIDYCTYLNERTLKKIGNARCAMVLGKKEEVKNKGLVKMLYSLLVIILLFFPIGYILRNSSNWFEITPYKHLIAYVMDYNYFLAFYSITINSIYFILLLISLYSVSSQAKYWKIKSMNLLFKKRILPTISIIAPAFNEEATIIESVSSLLNLRYPDYNIIVVNDGSKDQTLNKLINYFQLERIDYIANDKINTMPVRAVYANSSISKLVIIDKENGGKADSLNAGINLSKKEYFCGIDADSILEDDSLIKLASLSLDTAVETIAIGGNILPVNGCVINKGFLEEIHIPKNKYALLQTIEYIRAFMCGRMAWAQIDSLLIVSGAFGLFKKDRVIEIGGYLTSSGKYEKDTVGEDMEVVTRLSRYMMEKKLKFKVFHSYNANCWTEVPENMSLLRRQRDRWHRGLIDILTFHKKLIFNPKYKKVGLISFPYFLIFEVVGPLIEIQGYIMVVLAGILGLLNPQIALLLFVSTIFMGTLTSLSSLLLLETEKNYFSIKEIMILILFSIIENFGFRQIVSLWRVFGYLNSMKKPKGWGKMERKGFNKN